ncbi:MAG: 16S rRNA (guanine(966)-N(2))-methyltransferase RsmD [Draconibacterium sp.]
MRIVGGTFKGRIFRPNKSFKSRPTTDIAKEGLFNILENRYDFSSKKILDIFSGTGSIGYEFVSRGVLEATLVEINFIHYKFILSVLEALKIKNIRVLKADAFKFVQKSKESFDIIFADPPFDLRRLNEIPDAIFNSNVLKENGLFILEHPKEFDFASHKNFREIRKYGKVNFSFFEH